VPLASTAKTTVLVAVVGIFTACGASKQGSITGDEAVSVRLGTPKADVVKELGEPLTAFRRRDTRLTRDKGRVDSCIVYRSGDNPPKKQGWRLCFDKDQKLATRGGYP